MIEPKDLYTIFDNIHKLTVYDIKELFANNAYAYASQSITVFLSDKILANTKGVRMTDIIDYPQVIETYVLHIEKIAKTDGDIILQPNKIYGIDPISMKAYAVCVRHARDKLGLKKFTEIICGYTLDQQ